jgi:hypothetical protein
MIKKISNDIYNLFTITYKKARKKIINIIKTVEDLPKEVISYFKKHMGKSGGGGRRGDTFRNDRGRKDENN